MPSENHSRRRFLGTAGALAMGAATMPADTAHAQSAGAITKPPAAGPAAISRTVGRTGQSVTALGLGTFLTFDLMPGASRATLRDVFQRYLSAGGRVVDTSPLYGSAEVNVGAFLAESPAAQDVFLANKIWATGEYLGDTSHALASLEQSKLRIWRETIDLMQCHSLVNAPVILALLRAWKLEGKIRHVGVTHHDVSAHNQLATIVESGQVDVVQTNYSIFSREAERRLLPAAADKGVGVFVNLPLEKARLMSIIQNRPLPDFAAEFGATTWAQFFLKWVIANPAVTCVLCGTSNPDHASDNVQAMSGALPDQAMRRRMVAYMESIPGFADIGKMPWYPGKERMYPGLIRRAQADARTRLGEKG